MKTNFAVLMNEKIKIIFLIIKDVKETYHLLDEYVKRKNKIEKEYEIGNIPKEEYEKEIEYINKKILELESKIYINLGKIKQNIFLLQEELNRNYKIREESREMILNSLKDVIRPILEYKSQNREISSEILKIEEELNKIEKIPEISKVEKFEIKKTEKYGKYDLKNLYKIEKKIKKRERKIDFIKIFIEISSFIFDNLSNYILDKYPDLHYNLRKLLFKGKINISPSKFLSALFFSFFVISIIFFGLFIFLFDLHILLLLPISITGFLIFLYAYTNYRINQIRKNIDSYLPFASIHILSMLQTGLDIENCFRLLSETENYGYLSMEFKRLADLLNAGISFSDAIEHVRDTTVSERFREFLDELLLTLRSGRSIKEFFLIYTENQLILYRTDLEKLNQAIKTFSDLYVGLVLTIPMLMISVGIMMSTISPTIFGLQISEFLNVLSLILLPIINMGVIIFISKLEI